MIRSMREQLIKALYSKSATKVTNSSIYSSDSAISGTLNGGGVNGVHNSSIHLLSPIDYLLETYSEEDIEYYNKIDASILRMGNDEKGNKIPYKKIMILIYVKSVKSLFKN